MSNYPAGAENDPFAPYNEKQNSKQKFTLAITQTIAADIDVKSSNYVRNADGDIDYSETDWENVLNDDMHYTPIQLLDEYRKFAIRVIEYAERHYPNDKRFSMYKKEAASFERDFDKYDVVETTIEPI